MRMMSLLPAAAGLSLLATLSLASPALADMVKMTATMDGVHEVPANDSAGKGTADVTFDTDSKKLDWTIEYSGLSGPAMAGHFHGPAEPGKNAGVQVPLKGDLASPIKGSATLTDDQAKDLMAGKYYVNLHTAAHKGGEIRGQVMKAGM